MKRTFIIILFGSLMLSCKKTSNGIPVGMSVNFIPNNPWLATSYDAYIDIYGTISTLVIEGNDSNLISSPGVDEVTLMISNFSYKSGVYNVNGTSASISHHFSSFWIDASSGTIIITQVSDHNVQGTFNCIFSGATTNGQFNVPIQ